MRTFRGDPFEPARRAIETAIKRRRVTPQELERAAGLGTGHLSRILSGKIKTCDAVTICVLADALAVDVAALLPQDEIAELYRAELRLPERPARKRRA